MEYDRKFIPGTESTADVVCVLGSEYLADFTPLALGMLTVSSEYYEEDVVRKVREYVGSADLEQCIVRLTSDIRSDSSGGDISYIQPLMLAVAIQTGEPYIPTSEYEDMVCIEETGVEVVNDPDASSRFVEDLVRDAAGRLQQAIVSGKQELYATTAENYKNGGVENTSQMDEYLLIGYIERPLWEQVATLCRQKLAECIVLEKLEGVEAAQKYAVKYMTMWHPVELEKLKEIGHIDGDEFKAMVSYGLLVNHQEPLVDWISEALNLRKKHI